jgi:sulfonate transport system ATP-binding protein
MRAWPDVLLLDEPFRGLDVVTKFDVQDKLLKFLAEHEIPVVMVSHDVSDAVYFADRVCVLRSGPLEIEREIPVRVPKPRERGQEQLVATEAAVIRQLSLLGRNSSETSPNRQRMRGAPA